MHLGEFVCSLHLKMKVEVRMGEKDSRERSEVGRINKTKFVEAIKEQ